jgi:hypothetical protein
MIEDIKEEEEVMDMETHRNQENIMMNQMKTEMRIKRKKAKIMKEVMTTKIKKKMI